LDRWWAAGMAGSYGPNPLKNCLYSWDSPFGDRNVPQCGIRYMVYSCNPVWSSTNTGFEHCSCRVEAAKDGEWTVENEGIPILGRVVFSTIVFVATNGGCVFMYIYIYTHLYIHTYIYIYKQHMDKQTDTWINRMIRNKQQIIQSKLNIKQDINK
jgi:hypothetical protein